MFLFTVFSPDGLLASNDSLTKSRSVINLFLSLAKVGEKETFVSGYKMGINGYKS